MTTLRSSPCTEFGLFEPHATQVLAESLLVLTEIEGLIRDAIGLDLQEGPLQSQDPAVMELIPPQLLDALEVRVHLSSTSSCSGNFLWSCTGDLYLLSGCQGNMCLHKQTGGGASGISGRGFAVQMLVCSPSLHGFCSHEAETAVVSECT